MVLVLTVIGLLAGSIVVVRDMIRNAQVQSVINDEDRYKKAIQLFKEKYNYLPGDMPTATNFWGTDSGCPNTGYSGAEAVPKTATCNGDGNGRIDTTYESMRAWQQLANAGFIQGEYSGIQGNANAYSLATGTDVPASRIPACGWMVGFIPAFSSQTGIPATATQGTYLALVAGGDDQGFPPCLTPAESYSIDTKIDDGIPASGNVIDGGSPWAAEEPGSGPTWVWGNSTPIVQHTTTWLCTPLTNAREYNVTSPGIYCDPFFNTGL